MRIDSKPGMITLPQPDDAHIHLRDDDGLRLTVPHAARQFGRAIVMPNLKTPITTVDQMVAYYERIQQAVPEDLSFSPKMTLYLQADMRVETLNEAQKKAYFLGCKLYPQGVTTHSEQGVSRLSDLETLLEQMEKKGIPLLIHGEVSDPACDIFDREKRFIDEILSPWSIRFPALKISLEHITTADAVAFIQSVSGPIGASITAHHLLLNRNDLLSGGIKPDHYCLPIVKRERDRAALLKAATSGDRRFFLGTDSAPHPRSQKYSACGCAGIYTAHAAIELYAWAFDKVGALEKLPDFILNVSRFYGWPEPSKTIRLVRQEQQIPTEFVFQNEILTPFWAGKTLPFALQMSC